MALIEAERFVNPIPPEFECSICLGVLNYPDSVEVSIEILKFI
jgi:hypothetical protein